MILRYWCIGLLICSCFTAARGQADSVTIADIVIVGHSKTRSWVIFRELGLKKGERIATEALEGRLERSYSTLMNTGLFASSEITHSDTLLGPGQEIVQVAVRETWYIYPVPTFELADRNFNVWWTEQNRSLDRVNVGMKLSYYNFTGRRDKLNAGFNTGYTREYEGGYRFPYVNKKGTLGFAVGYKYQKRREQNYQTRNNEQLFFNDPDAFVYRTASAKVELNYRRKLYVNHDLELGYRDSRIADTIARRLNPNFFGGGRSSQKFFRARYSFTNDRRDVRNYPWAGKLIQFSLIKEGLGITGERSGMTVNGTYARFFPLGKNYSLNFGLGGKYSLIRTRQPFLENRAIGFGGNDLLGYQFYVVDGLDMAIWRVGLRRKIFASKLDLGKMVFIPAFRYVPLRILAGVQFNQGVANSPFLEQDNGLNNRLLTGFAAGLDFVLYYDMVLAVQYNRNHLGEDGIFVNLALSF